MCRLRSSNSEARALAIPEADRGRPAPPTVFWSIGLDELFPGRGLGEAFEDFGFRSALRQAGIQDLVTDTEYRIRDDQKFKDEMSFFGLLGEVHTILVPDEMTFTKRDGELGKAPCPALDEVLKPFGLTGSEFTMGLHDIVKFEPGVWFACFDYHFRDMSLPTQWWHQDTLSFEAVQEWYQDKAVPQFVAPLTVLLGFPKEDYDPNLGTTGVFSHLVRLSHEDFNYERLRAQHFDEIQDYSDAFGFTQVPDDLVIKPRVKRGHEILCYADSFTYHSTPDVIHRDGLWRIR